jgi:hypothetical protein
MKRKTKLALAMAVLVALVVVGAALALGSGPQVSWDVMAGAGGVSSNGAEVEFMDTIGQPVVGYSSGGRVDLNAGFWYLMGVKYGIYLPMMVR